MQTASGAPIASDSVPPMTGTKLPHQKFGGFQQYAVPARPITVCSEEDAHEKNGPAPPSPSRSAGGWRGSACRPAKKRQRRRMQRKVNTQRQKGFGGKLCQQLGHKVEHQVVSARRSRTAARNQNPAEHRRKGHHKERTFPQRLHRAFHAAKDRLPSSTSAEAAATTLNGSSIPKWSHSAAAHPERHTAPPSQSGSPAAAAVHRAARAAACGLVLYRAVHPLPNLSPSPICFARTAPARTNPPAAVGRSAAAHPRRSSQAVGSLAGQLLERTACCE